MEIKTLNNPPISEALLEIRFNPNKDVTTEKLEQFVDSLSTDYPNKKPVFDQSIEVMFSADNTPKHNIDVQPGGFKITNTQGNRIVIAAIDKLVVSFLPPYRSWPELKDSTKDLFERFVGIVPQTQITRLGMRYINKIKLPLNEDFAFQKYINTFPPLPKYDGLPSTLSVFETTISVPLHDIECGSTIRQSAVDSKEDKGKFLTIVLDIDVFQSKNYDSDNWSEIWGVYDNMREKRNAIFFGSLTDEALAPYE